MSETTPNVPASQAPSSTQQAFYAALHTAPILARATARQWAALLLDHQGTGLDLSEYVDGVTTWPVEQGIDSLLAEAGLEPEEYPTADAETAVAFAKLLEQGAPASTTEQAGPAPEKVTLAAVVSEYRRGQRGLAKHHLEAGRLACGLVVYRVKVLGHERAAAVRAIHGQLCDVSGRDVDVSTLMATWQAVRLLGEGVDYSRVPYSTLEIYAVLVERNRDTEDWSSVPGVAEKVVALFREASTSEPCMPLRDVAKRVDVLRAESKATVAAQLAQAAAAPDAPAVVKERAAAAQKQADKAAAKVAAQTSKPATTTTTTTTPAEAAKPQQASTRAVETRPEPVRLQDMAKAGTAKHVAEMAVELVEGNDAPDDVVEHLLRMLRDSKHTSKGTKRAIHAAIVLLERNDRPGPSPVDVAKSMTSPNGAVAAVA